MKILFLHGWQSTPGGLKPTYLKDHGHEVLNPKLPDDDFDAAVRIAQQEFDQGKPDVVVGSNRGGAVAMNIDAGTTPLVLLCPAWKFWGMARTVKPGTIILHSQADDVVPFADSEELVRNSGLDESALIVVGNDHRLADPEPLKAMLEAVERTAVRAAMEWSGLLEAIETARYGGEMRPAIAHEVGVPPRFGVGVLLLISSMYAVLFAVLRVMGLPPMIFGTIALFLTVVGLGQMLLFKGQHPRRASVIIGMCFSTCLSAKDAVGLACRIRRSNIDHPIRLAQSVEQDTR